MATVFKKINKKSHTHTNGSIRLEQRSEKLARVEGKQNSLSSKDPHDNVPNGRRLDQEGREAGGLEQSAAA